MSFGEQTATIGGVGEKESREGGFPRSSHLRGGWRGGTLISKLTYIGKVSTGRGKISSSLHPLGKWRGEALKHYWQSWSLGEFDTNREGSGRREFHRGDVAYLR